MRYAHRFTASFATTALLAAYAGAVQAQPAVAGYSEFLSSADKYWSLLDQYCVGCHNFNDFSGQVAFDLMAPEDVPVDAKIWEAAIRKLRGGLMPPPGADNPQPARADVVEFIAWLENYLDTAAALKPNAGYVPLARLNRAEYANEILRWLGVNITGVPVAGIPASSLNVANLLSADPKIDGFDNIADLLKVTPGYLQELTAAARDIARLAIGSNVASAADVTYQQAMVPAYVAGMPLGTLGGYTWEHYFPTSGEYLINAVGTGTMLLHNGQPIENGATLQISEPGIHRFAATGAAPSAPPTNILAGTSSGGWNWLTNIANPAPVSRGVRIRGPQNVQGLSQTFSRQKIFVCYPQSPEEETPCALQIFTHLTQQAYRGWATAADAQALMSYYHSGYAEFGTIAGLPANQTSGTAFERGIERALMALLTSPKVLLKVALTPENAVAGQNVALSDLELASRLSFFLWREGPDAELLRVAAAGELSNPQVLEAQTLRLLADRRAQSLVTDFAFKSLAMEKLQTELPQPALYPVFNTTILGYMEEEMRLFLADILFGDVPVTDILSADYTYLNQPLAEYYGINGVVGGAFRKVQLGNREERWGLLGKGAIQVLTSFGNRTAPVIRGDWILVHVLGTPPAAPPPGVETALENSNVTLTSVRAQLEQHRDNPTCYSCHAIIDPLGLSLENFDADGRWRDTDRYTREMVDAAGMMPDGTDLDGAIGLRRYLEARSEQFVQTLTKNLLMYALGRLLGHDDMPMVRAIVQSTAEEGNHFSALLLNVVQSDAFRMRYIPEAPPSMETVVALAP